MSQNPEEIVAIERGEMSDEDWDSMQKMAILYRGSLVTQRAVEQPSGEDEQPTDGI